LIEEWRQAISPRRLDRPDNPRRDHDCYADAQRDHRPGDTAARSLAAVGAPRSGGAESGAAGMTSQARHAVLLSGDGAEENIGKTTALKFG